MISELGYSDLDVLIGSRSEVEKPINMFLHEEKNDVLECLIDFRCHDLIIIIDYLFNIINISYSSALLLCIVNV